MAEDMNTEQTRRTKNMRFMHILYVHNYILQQDFDTVRDVQCNLERV